MVDKQLMSAYKEVDNEIDNNKLELFKQEVKAYKLEQLNKQEELKSSKEKIEEKLRIVKLNLDNLDKGNFEAIEERMKRSENARLLSNFNFYVPDLGRVFDPIWTTGTFHVTTQNGKKTFYF